jgi:hypothetical protein
MHLFKRRPSASMIVSLVALFAALGGVGYAAVSVPRNSVGTAQLQNGAVTNHKLGANAVGSSKIKPNSVGRKRINPNQVQIRVGGTCTTGAMTSIDSKGKVACASAPGAEFDTSTKAPTSVTSVDTAGSTKPTIVTLNSEPLPGGSSYLGLATPSVEVASTSTASQHVKVDCAIALGPSPSSLVTRSATVDIDKDSSPAFLSIPLSATQASSTSSTTGSVACECAFTGGSPAPTVKVQSTLNVLQTASNTTTTPAS